MLWTIAKREFLSHLQTFRFGAGLVLCMGLVSLSTFVLTKDYERRLEAYNIDVQKHKDELKNIHVWSALQPRIDRRPEVLSIFNRGIERKVGTTIRIYWGKVPSYTLEPDVPWGWAISWPIREIPSYAARQGKENPYLEIFPILDLVTVVAVVLSLLAILFAYDAVVGEKEMGTLRLALSNPVPRDKVLLGKYIAGMACLSIPLLLSFITALIVMELSPAVSLKVDDFGRIGLMFLFCLVYVSAFFLLGLLFSSRTSRRSTCLALLLVCWVLFVVIVPNAGPYLAKRVYPTVSPDKVRAEKRALWGEMWEKIRKANVIREGGPYMIYLADVNGLGRLIRYSPKKTMDSDLRYYRFVEPLRIEYAEKEWRIEEARLGRLSRQMKLAKVLSSISPVTPFSSATAALAGTDIQSMDRFMEAARRYRRQFIGYLRSKDAFNSYRFFSDDTEEDRRWAEEFWRKLYNGEIKLPLSADIRQAIMERHERDLKDPSKKLRLDDMPVFVFRPEGTASRLERALLDLGILILFNLAFFLGAFASFLRYDVR